MTESELEQLARETADQLSVSLVDVVDGWDKLERTIAAAIIFTALRAVAEWRR